MCIRLYLLFFIFLHLFVYAEDIWLEELHGLTFIQKVDEENPLDAKNFSYGINIVDVYVPDEKAFIKEMQQFLGLPLKPSLIKEIKQQAVQYYQKRGFLLVGVLVPVEQDISNGVLKIIINIGRLGKIKASGAKYFSNEKLASELRVKEGEYLQKDVILSDLNWMNQNPFRASDVVLEQGENFGETDLTLSTIDRWPVRFFGGYENTGNQIAGSSRFLTGINLGNLFKIGHQLNYLFRFSPQFNKWWGHSGSYIAPLPWRHIFEAYGFYTHAKPDVDVGFDSNGKSWQLAGRYKIPFQTGFLNNLIFIGYEFQRSNNFLTFGDTLLFDRYIDISQFLVGYEAFIEYKAGKTKIGAEIFLSPGNMTAFNNDQSFAQEQEGAKSNYIFGRTRLEQSVYMPKGAFWWLDILFQQASGKLLPTEQFSLGGFYTIRGYDENEVIGDNGILIKNELHFPVIRLPPKKRYHQIQFLGFIDYGWTYDVNQNILSKDVATLASVGPGVRYNFENYISFRFDYGWQLNTIRRVVDPSSKKSRAHLSLIVSY
ncbi:MAG: ShlB/FhaC/HecB family hemolysin secretion/activation protein [Chlamydiota bacterium]|jgi:hemolysin activation/secretion protein